MAEPLVRVLRGLSLCVVGIGLPALALLGMGAVGTKLSPSTALYATVGLFVLFFVGLPSVGLSIWRWFVRPRSKRRVRARVPSLRQMRPPGVYELPSAARPEIGLRRRIAALSLVPVMFVGGFALWTVIPFGWLWIGSQLASSTQPAMLHYVVIIVGIPATAAVVMKVLSRLGALHSRITEQRTQGNRRPGWLKSLRDGRHRQPWSTLDRVMAASVVAAVACLTIWFTFFAQQHSFIQQGMN
jgi:hypothetical protein